MCRLLCQLITGILVCLFVTVNVGLAQNNDVNIEYDAAFTIRDVDLDGLPDALEDDPSGSFWGLITNSDFQYDEFYLEFDIRDLEPVTAAKFYFFFSRSTPQLSPGQTITVSLANYEADGISDINKFGIGNEFTEMSISSLMEINSIDVTDIINDYINLGISHLGIRLYNPFSSISPTGRPAQLDFAIGYLNIISFDKIADMNHPTGAVHAYPNLLWPPNNKKVKVKIQGYVFDEMSAAKDQDGVGVSEAYILINERKKIILRDETTNLLEPDGSFKVKVPLKAKKYANYKIQLFATDTAVEEDGGPNEGLVDQTKVIVPNDRGKGGDDNHDKKKKKKKKK